MATFPIRAFISNTRDPETGCIRGYYKEYEQCRANFFLKQQNQILQQKSATAPASTNTTSNIELEELRAQLEQQKTEIESLKTQQVVLQNFSNPAPTSPYPLMGIGLVIGLIVGAVIVKLLKPHK